MENIKNNNNFEKTNIRLRENLLLKNKVCNCNKICKENNNNMSTSIILKSLQNLENNIKKIIINQNSTLLEDVNSKNINLIKDNIELLKTKKNIEEKSINKENQNNLNNVNFNINNLIKRVNNLENLIIPNLKKQIKASELPIGSIIFSNKMPEYGNWNDLGELFDEQSIIDKKLINKKFNWIKIKNHIQIDKSSCEKSTKENNSNKACISKTKLKFHIWKRID